MVGYNMKFNIENLTYKENFNSYGNINGIDEILHYYKVSGKNSALNFYNNFNFSEKISFKNENRIITALNSENVGLLENVISDIKKEQIRKLKNYYNIE